MSSRSRLIIVGTATLLVGLMIFFPARVAYHWAAPPDVALSGLYGSVWSGGATEASTSGVYLRDLRWQLSPLTFFTGRIGYAFEASPASGFIDGKIAIGFGTITMTDVNAALPLQSLEQVLGIRGIRGNASMTLDKLQLRNGLPVAATGFIEVANLQVPAIDRSSIGGYRAELFSEESAIAASVEDTDGVVDLAGSFKLSADRSYQFTALLSAKAEASASMRKQLQFLGSANDRGQHELRLEGQL
jgi:general secretion pathway protein N